MAFLVCCLRTSYFIISNLGAFFAFKFLIVFSFFTSGCVTGVSGKESVAYCSGFHQFPFLVSGSLGLKTSLRKLPNKPTLSWSFRVHSPIACLSGDKCSFLSIGKPVIGYIFVVFYKTKWYVQAFGFLKK